jgi:EmrB/QacA subfamily drug resistance transporter
MAPMTRDQRLTIVATSLATFIGILDSSIVNLGLRTLGQQLGAGVSTLQWVVDSYNLVYAAMILSGGALADLYGKKRIFLIGTAILGAGSVLCAAAPSAALLIAGRGLSGIGAALQLATSLAIVGTTFDGAARTRAIAIWVSANGLAVGIGPIAGGLLIEALGWRSMFYVVIPFLAASAWLGARHIPESRRASVRRLDAPGQLGAVVAVGALAVGLIQFPLWGLTSPKTILALLVAAAAVVLFVVRERVARVPIVPLDLFKSAQLSASVAAAVCMTFGWYTFLFVFPLYLQVVLEQSSARAGIELLPMSLGFFLVSAFLTARLVAWWGARAVISIGMALVAACLVAVGWAAASPRYSSLAMFGMAVGFALAAGPLSNLAVASVPAERSGIASGLFNAARMLGATLGVAIIGTVLGGRGGAPQAAEVANGMHPAFAVAALVEIVGAGLAAFAFRRDSLQHLREATQ